MALLAEVALMVATLVAGDEALVVEVLAVEVQMAGTSRPDLSTRRSILIQARQRVPESPH